MGKSPIEKLGYADFVGKVPDSDIAEAAGVTVGAVRQWRNARGIPRYTGPARLPPATAAEITNAERLDSTAERRVAAMYNDIDWFLRKYGYLSMTVNRDGVVTVERTVTTTEQVTLRKPGPVKLPAGTGFKPKASA